MKDWKNHIEIIVLTIWVALFRLVHLFDFPINHDEYSSLIRTDFSSFSDLIQRGVMTDAHPPFLQVFLFYWVKFFGTESWVIKLPFVLFSTASVPLVYAFAKSWWGKGTALLTAAGTGLLFLPAYYGMMARPYASGIFFIALLAFAWTKLVKENPSWKWMVVTGVSFALCAFNHHFTALYAFFIWVSGWFLINRMNVRYYVGSTVIAVLIYSFNFPVLLAQLNLKGIGGVNPMPQPTFVFEHLWYVFNYSWLVLAVVLIGLLVGFLQKKNTSKITLHVFFWWILPIVVGYVYSHSIDSLLNDRSLLFGIPFLLAVLFSGLKELERTRSAVLAAAFGMVLMGSTLYERGLYRVNIGSALSELPKHPEQDEVAFVSMSDTIAQFVKKGSAEKWQKITDTTTFVHVHRILEQSKESNALFGWGVHRITPSLDYLGVIKEYYPSVKQSKGFVDGEYWILDKSEARGHDIKNTLWTFEYKNELKVAGDEYPYAVELPLDENHRNDLILFSVGLAQYNQVPDVLAVLTILHNGEQVHWQGRSAAEMIPSERDSGSVHTVLRLLDIPYPLDECTLKILVWNRGKSTFDIEDTFVEFLPGNSKLYKHIAP